MTVTSNFKCLSLHQRRHASCLLVLIYWVRTRGLVSGVFFLYSLAVLIVLHYALGLGAIWLNLFSMGRTACKIGFTDLYGGLLWLEFGFVVIYTLIVIDSSIIS